MILIVTRRNAFQGWKNEIQTTGFFLEYLIVSADNLTPIIKALKSDGLKTASGLSVSPANTMLLVDELYMFSNHKSKRSQKMNALSIMFDRRIGLSGTVMPTQNNLTIWGQAWSFNFENLLARNVTQFRSIYQQTALNVYSPTGREWVNKPDSKEKILDALKDYVHTHFPNAEDRNVREQIVKCKLTVAQRKMIKQLEVEYQLELGEKLFDFRHAISIYYAVCDITAGFFDTEVFPSDKIEQTIRILEDVLADPKQKVVVWFARRNELTHFENCLQEKHNKWARVRFWSQETFRQSKWEEPDTRICLATIASGSSVNYFAQCEYAIYFSLDRNPVSHAQSLGRHERKSSKHSGAFYYFMQTNNHIDSLVLKALKNNMTSESDLLTTMMQNLKNSCMTNQEQTHALAVDLDALLHRHMSEFDLSYASIIGVLQMKVVEICLDAKDSETEDDEETT